MRILYFSDTYAYEVMGVKRSIYEELVRQGNAVMFQDKRKIGEILRIVGFYKPDQIWLAHSGLVIPKDTKRKIKVPVIGFGFSDPNNFTEKRLEAYDAYITNHYETFLTMCRKLPCHYNPTACDLRFHKNLGLKKYIDASFLGIAVHPHFKNKNERVEIITRLQEETDLMIGAWGDGWPDGKIKGQSFLKAINRSKVGLDIQDVGSPLSHRMLEYSACGVPVITRSRPEVERVFKPDKEILVYDSYDDLKEKLICYLGNVKKLNQIGLNAQKRCEREHDIKYRIDKILNFSINFKNFEIKSIAFVTRVHPRRPNMLKTCVKSVKAQTSDDYIHILHRDDNTEKGYGVLSADRSLVKVRPINAQYVMVLDDDDMLIDPNFVEIFAKVTEKDVPEIVFFRGIITDRGVFPREKIWGKPPLRSLIASFCFAVRRDVWMNYIHKFDQKSFSDFAFISHCYSKTKNHLWLNRVVAQTQKGPGKGQGENKYT